MAAQRLPGICEFATKRMRQTVILRRSYVLLDNSGDGLRRDTIALNAGHPVLKSEGLAGLGQLGQVLLQLLLLPARANKHKALRPQSL